MANRPESLPRWATDGGTTVEPLTGEKDTGYEVDKKPPARKMNWLLNNSYEWHLLNEQMLRPSIALNWRSSSPGGTNFYETAAWVPSTNDSGPGRWYIGADTGEVRYSDTRGVLWSLTTLSGSPTDNVNSIYYDDTIGTTVIGGDNGLLQEGGHASWTNVNPLASCAWSHIKGNGAIFVALGYLSATMRLYTSVDGVTWTSRTLAATTGTPHGLAYGNGVWVLVDDDRRVQTSPDGITWTDRGIKSQGGAGTTYYGDNNLAFGDGVFVTSGDFVGPTFLMGWSTDGVTWTDCTYVQPNGEPDEEFAAYNGTYTSFAYDQVSGLWIAGSDIEPGRVLTSHDGKEWTPHGHGNFFESALSSTTKFFASPIGEIMSLNDSYVFFSTPGR